MHWLPEMIYDFSDELEAIKMKTGRRMAESSS
jgi:hypothetical protein